MKALFILIFLTLPGLLLSAPTKAESLIAKGIAIGNQNIDSGLVIFKKAVEVALAESDSMQEARAYFFLGRYHVRKSFYSKALEYYQLGYDGFKALRDDFRANSCTYEMGNCYNHLKMFDEALECYFQSLYYMESRHDSIGEINKSGLLANIGGLYIVMNNVDEAMVHLKEAYRIGKESGDSARISHGATILGVAMLEADMDSSMFYLDEARFYAEQLGNYRDQAIIESRLGQYYADRQKPEKAQIHFEKGLEFAEKVQDLKVLTENNRILAHIHLELGDYTGALRYALQALDYSEQGDLIGGKVGAYKELKDIYAGLGAFPEAYSVFQQYHVLNDSMNNRTQYLEIGRVEGRYQVQLKEEQLARQNEKIEYFEERDRKNEQITRLWIMVILLLTMSIAATLAFFILRRKKDKRILEQEQLLAKTLQQSLKSKEKEVVDLAAAISYKNQILYKVDSAIRDVGQEAEVKKIKVRIKGLKRELNHMESGKQQVERLFALGEDIQREFHLRLRTNFELTPRDLRICTLVRLKLSIKEIAGVLNVSEKAVEMAKYRLKKKMNLNSSENLNAFIQEF